MPHEDPTFPPRSQKPGISVGLTGVAAKGEIGSLTPWISYNFASDWYADAKNETKNSNHHARRREILFSVACAESYLLEWARDQILKRDHPSLDRYFPPGNNRPIAEKWKDVPKQLKDHGLIHSVPNLGGGSAWGDFLRLVEFRNGLLHARASRPETPGLSASSLPVPSMDQLRSLSPGWACGVVSRLIQELNAAAGTNPPDWITHT